MKNIAEIITIGMAVATTAFVPSSPPLPTSTSLPIRRASSNRQSGGSSTGIFFRDDDVADVDVEQNFQSMMRNIISQQTRQRREVVRLPNARGVVSLKEFTDELEEGRREGKLVVVRFHATWCKVRNLCCVLLFWCRVPVFVQIIRSSERGAGIRFALLTLFIPNAFLMRFFHPFLSHADMSRHTPVLRQGGIVQSPSYIRRRSRPGE